MQLLLFTKGDIPKAVERCLAQQEVVAQNEGKITELVEKLAQHGVDISRKDACALLLDTSYYRDDLYEWSVEKALEKYWEDETVESRNCNLLEK